MLVKWATGTSGYTVYPIKYAHSFDALCFVVVSLSVHDDVIKWNHFRVTICAGNSPVIGELPAQRPVTRSFDVFICAWINAWVNKQSRGWWFETPSRPLRRHCNVLVVSCDPLTHTLQGLCSLNRRTSYRKISWSLEAARLDIIMIVSLWNLTGMSAALLSRCMLNFRAIGKSSNRNLAASRLREILQLGVCPLNE